MKLIARLLTSLFVFVLFAGGSGYGQASAGVIRVNIPFEFAVGAKSFPAGNYSLVQPTQHFLVLRNERGQTIASTLTNIVDAPGALAEPRLRFKMIDGEHVLAELWQAKDPEGQQLVLSKPQRTNLARRHTVEAQEAAEGSQP